jgi:SP family facilitated glucose transporter-like MFS transporter 8
MKRCNWTAFVFIAVNLATFSYGTCVGWPTPAIATLQSRETPMGRNSVTEDDASWLRSLMFVGVLCGTPIFSYISDKFGRKIAGLLIALPAIISWLIIILGSSIHFIFIARFINGLSTAGVLLIVPVYVGEICEDSIRGALGTYLSIFANFGVLFSHVVGPYASYYDFAIICLAVPIIFLATFLWMPETPVYLMKKGEVKKAKRSLKWLRGRKQKDFEDELTSMSVLLKKTREKNSSRSSIMNVLLDRGMRRALTIGIVVSTIQILSGPYVILSYKETISKMTGNDLPPIIFSLVLLCAAILACFLMDRAGRKTLLLSSQIVMGICLTFMGLYFYLRDQGVDLSNVFFIPLVCLGLHLFSFGGGIGPVNMVLLSEIFLPHVRSTSASICTFLMAFLACLVTRFYSYLNSTMGVHGPFWFIAACCFLAALFTVTSIPETKNKNMNWIYAQLSGKECSIIPIKKSYEILQGTNENIAQIILPSVN